VGTQPGGGATGRGAGGLETPLEGGHPGGQPLVVGERVAFCGGRGEGEGAGPTAPAFHTGGETWSKKKDRNIRCVSGRTPTTAWVPYNT